MDMRVRTPLSALLLIACVVAAATPAVAHPPWNPYDTTRFAPITSFGPKVGIELVTKGTNDPVTGAPIGPTLTSPLKIVTAPGLTGHIFIVDQVGKLKVEALWDELLRINRALLIRKYPVDFCSFTDQEIDKYFSHFALFIAATDSPSRRAR